MDSQSLLLQNTNDIHDKEIQGSSSNTTENNEPTKSTSHESVEDQSSQEILDNMLDKILNESKNQSKINEDQNTEKDDDETQIDFFDSSEPLNIADVDDSNIGRSTELNKDNTLVNNDNETDELNLTETETGLNDLEKLIEAETELDELTGSETLDTSDTQNSSSKKVRSAIDKKCTLPISRVKLIMKTDPDVKIVSAEATIITALAAEHFLKFLVKETARVTKGSKKKTMMMQHFEEAIKGLDVTEFLDGMLDFKKA